MRRPCPSICAPHTRGCPPPSPLPVPPSTSSKWNLGEGAEMILRALSGCTPPPPPLSLSPFAHLPPPLSCLASSYPVPSSPSLPPSSALAGPRFAARSRSLSSAPQLLSRTLLPGPRACHPSLSLSLSVWRARSSRGNARQACALTEAGLRAWRALVGVRLWACACGRALVGVRLWACACGRALVGVRGGVARRQWGRGVRVRVPRAD